MFVLQRGWRSSKKFIVATICLAMFTDGFVFGVVVPVYPFLLQTSKMASADKLQLYTSVLTAAFPISDLIAAPICAYYVDHYQNRRIPWFVGLVGMVGGNVLFGIGNSFGLLLTSRLLQGAASAILYTVGLAVLVESVNKNEVGRYMGSAMSCNNFGIIMSPLLGGTLYETRGKMAVFGIMSAFIGIDIMMRITMVEQRDVSKLTEEKQRPPTQHLEHASTVHVQAVDHVSSNCCDLENNNRYDDIAEKSKITVNMCPKPDTETSSIQSANSDSRTNSGGSRFKGVLKLIRSPRLLAALYGCFINECIIASLCAVLPLFVDRTFHWTSLQAGCLFLTIAIPGLAGSLAGMLSDKFGARWVSVAGFVLTAPPLISMMAVNSHSVEQVALLCVLLTLAGCTIIFFLSPLGADLSIVADQISEELGMDLYASSFSLMNTALATAGVVGPLFVGWLQECLGWKGTCAAMGVLCLSGAIPCAFFTGSEGQPKQCNTA